MAMTKLLQKVLKSLCPKNSLHGYGCEKMVACGPGGHTLNYFDWLATPPAFVAAIAE